MGTEIERKFLIDSYEFMMAEVVDKGFAFHTQITQGYLSHDPTVRVRHVATGPSNAKGYITVKGRGTVTRSEWEYLIPEADALDMLTLCRAKLHKARYVVPVTEPGFTHLKWEVDQFYDKGLHGLWLAEIELTRPDEPFHRPAWLGKEVSEDPRYSNVSLARTHTIPGP
jgi:adenylate cyclase